ncbi:MAG TPA: hypothetical protein PKH94_11100 [Bacteroidales bacterium]|nr:hypothetical protein [Bacteroidales bacterium]HNS47777.1 hypothetical protein [Bacteroidales bacterium]
MKKHLSSADFLVIAITFSLFLVALFVKGFTHNLLLEAGVLLVSIKIIMMNYKNKVAINSLLNELKDIKGILREVKDRKDS